MANELLKPKIDDVFHALFREGHEDITKEMISNFIGEKIQKIELDKNRHLLKETPDEKLGILDLKAVLDGDKICNIEVQLSNQYDLPERILYYWSKLYAGQLVKGNTYDMLLKTISIVIIDFELDEIKGIDKAITEWKIIEESTGKKILTNRLEIIIIELPKARKMTRENITDAIKWALFLDNPNSTEVQEMVEENETLKHALEELRDISEDKLLRERAELREKYIKDYNTNMKGSKNEGIKIGRIEGEKIGRIEGEKESKKGIAKNMLKEKLDLQLISRVTGLSVEEIHNLE